jgi:hypothetical protein
MTTHQIPGFVPKKTVTERYNRSFRQLTRDVALAMQAKDEKILGHFKLVLDDGEPIDGIDVTTERIAQLRDAGRNPMWFVEEDWMASTYGHKSDRRQETVSQKTGHAEVADERSSATQSDILTLYERHVERLEHEVEHLRTEGAIKNEQIREASERQK